MAELSKNGWVDIPEIIFDELKKLKLNIVKKETVFTLYDKRIYYPYAIEVNNVDYYVCYIPNTWGRKSRLPFINESLTVVEEIAYSNKLNLIVISEQHILDNGAELIAKSILNRVQPQEHQNLALNVDKTAGRVEIFSNKEYAGYAVFNAQRTILTITDWFSYIDPSYWIDQLANDLDSLSYKIRVHEDDPLPYQRILSWNSGIKRTEHNTILNNGLRLYRTNGIFCIRKTSKDRTYDHKGINLPVRNSGRANYQSSRGILVKDNPFLLSKLSDKNDLAVYEKSSNSLTFALFICEHNHEYYSLIKEQQRFGCTICNSASVIEGINDLATTEPEIAKLWDYETNFPVRPTDVSRKSDKQFSWICPVSGGKWVSPVGRMVVTGGGSPFVSGLETLEGYNDLTTLYPFLPPLFSEDNDIDFPTLRRNDTRKFLWHCKVCGGKWLRTINSIIKNGGCRECLGFGKGSSKGEKELYDFVSSIYDGLIHRGSRSIIPPKELDIYIPEKKIAIEFNGLYWHSENMLSARTKNAKNYHYDKWKACRDAGIQLITVWEDEWRDKPEIVKSMLSHKLGISQNGKVYGRNVIVLDIDGDTAKEFCDKHHIQGFAGGTKYFALVNKHDLSEVFAVSVWRKLKNELYLDRYCTSVSVVGGMGKLLKAGEAWGKAMGCSQIITFADHQVSNGGLYHSLGFRVDKILKPDYRYIHEGLRKHKFGFRLKRFRNDPALKYVEGYTEKQLAELNDLPRLWDFGKTRFVKEIV